MIHQPTLPAISGYVEVEESGLRKYKSVKSGAVYLPSELPVRESTPETDAVTWDKLAAAYQEGVNEA